MRFSIFSTWLVSSGAEGMSDKFLLGVRGRAGLDFDNLLFSNVLNSDGVNYMCYFCICSTFCITSSGCVPMKFKAALQRSPDGRKNCTRDKT